MVTATRLLLFTFGKKSRLLFCFRDMFARSVTVLQSSYIKKNVRFIWVSNKPRADILPVRSRASLVNKRFITRLKLFRKKTSMIDCKDIINFMRAIFIESKLNVYSRLTFSKSRKTKLEGNKTNILCGVNTFRKRKEVKLRENLRTGSFGTVPGPILREYWTGNGPIWLADFSYRPSELT